MYPCNNWSSLWHKRQLITQLWLAGLYPLISHGSWHLKIDIAEIAVDIFGWNTPLLKKKKKNKKKNSSLLHGLCVSFQYINRVLFWFCFGLAYCVLMWYLFCQIIMDWNDIVICFLSGWYQVLSFYWRQLLAFLGDRASFLSKVLMRTLALSAGSPSFFH